MADAASESPGGMSAGDQDRSPSAGAPGGTHAASRAVSSAWRCSRSPTLPMTAERKPVWRDAPWATTIRPVSASTIGYSAMHPGPIVTSKDFPIIAFPHSTGTQATETN